MSDFKEICNFYKNKKVLVTGHTGFKGSWLVTWLDMLGSKLIGIGLDPLTQPNHFKIIKKNINIKDIRLDIKDEKSLIKVIQKFKSDIAFHLAAQAIVSNPYNHPKLTFEANVLGTLNLLTVLNKLGKKTSK